MKTTIEEQELIDKLQKLRPDLIVVPRAASSIMLLRASQEGPVFEINEEGQGIDNVHDFLTFRDLDANVRWDPDPADYLHEDPRQYWLCAAVWRGAIKGFEEWQRLRVVEGSTPMVESWDTAPVHDFNLVK